MCMTLRFALYPKASFETGGGAKLPQETSDAPVVVKAKLSSLLPTERALDTAAAS